ncbi:hypothetical protein BDD12DRAFT_977004 [Trichophaea hybrida]|nr:hypothetical protein BDD12DRAFT_977004 [Trichophaea hybrida]
MKGVIASSLLFAFVSSAQLLTPSIFPGISSGSDGLSPNGYNTVYPSARLDARPGYGGGSPIQQPPADFPGQGSVRRPTGYGSLCPNEITLVDRDNYVRMPLDGIQSVEGFLHEVVCGEDETAYPRDAPLFRGGGVSPRGRPSYPPAQRSVSPPGSSQNLNRGSGVQSNDDPMFLAPGVAAAPGPVILQDFPPETEIKQLKDVLVEQKRRQSEILDGKDESSSDSNDSDDSSDSNDSSDEEEDKSRPTGFSPGMGATVSNGKMGCFKEAETNIHEKNGPEPGIESGSEDEEGFDDEDDEEDKLEEAKEVQRQVNTESKAAESGSEPQAKNRYFGLAVLFAAVLLVF